MIYNGVCNVPTYEQEIRCLLLRSRLSAAKKTRADEKQRLTTAHLADTRGDDGAGDTVLEGTVLGALSETTLGETGPDLAGVVTAGEGLVGIEDGVTGVDEVGAAGLPGS